MKKDSLDVHAKEYRIRMIGISIVGLVVFALLLVMLMQRKDTLDKEQALVENNLSAEDTGVLAEDTSSEEGSKEQNENGTLDENRTEGNEIASEEFILPNTYTLPDEDSVTFTFAGDILLDDSYAIMGHYRAQNSVLSECIGPELLERMRSADVCMVNNEFTYTNRGTPTPNKAFTFRANPENVAILQEMGVDIVSLANNHAYDYGEISMLDTLDTLEEAGIPYVGAGRNLEEATKVVYYQNEDIKVGIVSATQIERLAVPDTPGATETTPGTFRCLDSALLEETIRQAKEQCDFVILYVHWGTENTNELDWSQPEQAEAYAQAGADVIIGDHPHVLQEIGYVEDTLVFYSLGNYWFSSKSGDSCLVTLELGKEGLVSAQFVPCCMGGSETHLATGDDAVRILDYMRGLSEGVFIDEHGYITPETYAR